MNFDTYTTAEAEELLQAAARRRSVAGEHRGLITQLCAGAIVLAIAMTLAGASGGLRAPSVRALAIAVGAFVVASRVRFPVAAGWSRPTQLVFVPMLFILPVTLVPFIVIGCLLAEGLPRFVRREVSLTSIVSLLGDSAYTLGPVLALVLTHEQAFTWRHWPLYCVAFLLQIGFDLTAYISRSWLAEGTMPRAQSQIGWAYLTDACLSCGGLLIAAAASAHPGLLLLSLPLIVLLGLFARERSERIEHTLALSTAYRGTALLLGDVIESDDEYTGIHSHQVVEKAMAVAERMGLDATARRNVEFGALLHDVGKIRIPKEIINKPGELSDSEWLLMREHTVFGEQMLSQLGGGLASVARVVRHSHERWDGTGYPDGLSGEEIPIESRIVSTCDAFNAMTTNRSYRAAMSLEQAVAEVLRCRGTQFDPRVVDELVALMLEREPELQQAMRLVRVEAASSPAAPHGAPSPA